MENQPLSKTEATKYIKPEIGMRIFSKKEEGVVIAAVPVQDERVTCDNFNNLIQRANCFHAGFFPRDIIEILEVGEGDQAGFLRIKVINNAHPEMWIQSAHLLRKFDDWRIDRRTPGTLLGEERLDEICDWKSDAVLRLGDDIRRLTIYAMQKKGEKSE